VNPHCELPISTVPSKTLQVSVSLGSLKSFSGFCFAFGLDKLPCDFGQHLAHGHLYDHGARYYEFQSTAFEFREDPARTFEAVTYFDWNSSFDESESAGEYLGDYFAWPTVLAFDAFNFASHECDSLGVRFQSGVSVDVDVGCAGKFFTGYRFKRV
jgi:hypothetical protein